MLKVFEFTPTPLNQANDTSPSGFTDIRTGQETIGGGLVLGDCLDLDERGANGLSNLAFGLLHEGRYRRIGLDPNATAANVKAGTVAYVVAGYGVYGALILTPGSGQTPGTYLVPATGGGGTGAVLSVVVSPSGAVLGVPTAAAQGSGYTSVPTFTLAAGGTPATFQAQTTFVSYNVTTADKALNTSAPRGIFLCPITPSNYGWIQENGVATVLQAATVTSGTLGAIVTPVAGGNGTSQATVATASALVSSIGVSLDVPVANALYRVLLTLAVWNG